MTREEKIKKYRNYLHKLSYEKEKIYEIYSKLGLDDYEEDGHLCYSCSFEYFLMWEENKGFSDTYKKYAEIKEKLSKLKRGIL